VRRAGGYPDVDLKLCDVTCRNNETLVVWNAVVAGLDPVTRFVLRGAFIIAVAGTSPARIEIGGVSM